LNAVAHYLGRYARAVAPIAGHFSHGITVPAFREEPDFLEHLPGPCLVVLVINQPGAAGDANHRMLHRYPPGVHRVGANTVWSHFAVLEHGVGEARKIGLDTLLSLWARGQLASPWLCTTDADAQLPEDYFDRLPDSGAACTFPFVHRCDPQHPVGQYERALRHYVAGLRWAGSPYAFHSIGSTLAMHAEAYAAVRGCPRRPGGEDFHLLNKLRKVGAVHTLPGAPIRLSARRSSRTPYGTGQQQGRIQLAYHPETFAALAAHLSAALAEASWGAARPRWLRDNPDPERAFHAHFDGLCTLQFIHRERDARWPSLPVADAEALAPW
jgi:hypothetical protein